MATAISFSFKSVYASTRYDLYQRAQFLSAKGYLIVTNGLDPNTKIDPDNGINDLIPRAPRDEVVPLTTFAPSPEGKIFGTGFKWRIRWKNSITGECSGASPVPAYGLNLGMEIIAGSASYLGQTAYFRVYGVATTTGFDTVQLFRNTSAQDDVWYLVATGSNPGAAATVSFTDNFPDEDIWNNEQLSLFPNPSYYTPHPPPCVRAHQHGTGRVFLYGMIDMGAIRREESILLEKGDTDASLTTGLLYRGREGQLFRQTTDTKRTQYRVVEVTDPNAFYFTPPTEAASNASGYEIVDDRDARNIYLTMPISPCQHDPTHVLTVGMDKSDGVKGIFSIGSTTFVLTKRHLWELMDDVTENPHLTFRVRKIADVGCVGFWAWCSIPFGCVFVDETQGVMYFSGQGLPEPLGSDGPLGDFLPKTQFQRFDRSLLSDVYCEWDPTRKVVTVAYCPDGVSAMTEQLVYDPAVGNWRGPWLRPMYRGGMLRNSTGKDVYLLGDQFGSLLLEEDITTDVATAATGVVSTFTAPNTLVATSNVFTAAQIGASIVFDDGAGNRYTNWIARRLGATTVQLMLSPVGYTPVSPWTFTIGAIHWTATTAFLDLGEPGQPKVLHYVKMRWDRIETGTDNIRVDCVSDGAGITETVDPTAFTGGLIWGPANLACGGLAFTLRLSGVAQYGNPQVTNALVHFDIRSGTAPATTSDSATSVLTPTVTL